jgi:hypothetical protein
MISYFSNEGLNKIIGRIGLYLLLYNYYFSLFFKLDFVFVYKLYVLIVQKRLLKYINYF